MASQSHLCLGQTASIRMEIVVLVHMRFALCRITHSNFIWIYDYLKKSSHSLCDLNILYRRPGWRCIPQIDRFEFLMMGWTFFDTSPCEEYLKFLHSSMDTLHDCAPCNHYFAFLRFTLLIIESPRNLVVCHTTGGDYTKVSEHPALWFFSTER